MSTDRPLTPVTDAPALDCNARVVLSWLPSTPTTRYCVLAAGHEGDHDANPSNPYRWSDGDEGAVPHAPGVPPALRGPRSGRADGRMCQCGAGVVGDHRVNQPICMDGLCWTRPESQHGYKGDECGPQDEGDDPNPWPGDRAARSTDHEKYGCNAVSSAVVGSHTCERAPGGHHGAHEALLKGYVYCWYDGPDTTPHAPGLPRPLPPGERQIRHLGEAVSGNGRGGPLDPPAPRHVAWGRVLAFLLIAAAIVALASSAVEAVNVTTERMVRCVATTEALGTAHDDAVRTCAEGAR